MILFYGPTGHIGTDDVPMERSALQYEGTEPGEESVKTEAWKRPVRWLKRVLGLKFEERTR